MKNVSGVFIVLILLFCCLIVAIPVKKVANKPSKDRVEASGDASGDATFEDFEKTEQITTFSQADKDDFERYFDNKKFIKYSSTTDVTNTETDVTYASRVLTAQVDMKKKLDKFTIKSKDSTGTNSDSYYNDRKNNIHRINGKLADDKTLDLDIDWDAKDMYSLYKSLSTSNDIPFGMQGTVNNGYKYFTVKSDIDASELDGYDYDKLGNKSIVYILTDKNELISVSDIDTFYISGVEYQKKTTFRILTLR